MRRAMGIAFGMLALAASCRETTTAPVGPSETALALERALMKWAMTAPPAYEVTVAPYCFCDVNALRPAIVRVRNGTVESRRYVDTGAEVPAQYAGMLPSVTVVFGFIAVADEQHAASIRATYDATYGFPASVFVDARAIVADDESGFDLTNFHPVP